MQRPSARRVPARAVKRTHLNTRTAGVGAWAPAVAISASEAQEAAHSAGHQAAEEKENHEGNDLRRFASVSGKEAGSGPRARAARSQRKARRSQRHTPHSKPARRRRRARTRAAHLSSARARWDTPGLSQARRRLPAASTPSGERRRFDTTYRPQTCIVPSRRAPPLVRRGLCACARPVVTGPRAGPRGERQRTQSPSPRGAMCREAAPRGAMRPEADVWHAASAVRCAAGPRRRR